VYCADRFFQLQTGVGFLRFLSLRRSLVEVFPFLWVVLSSDLVEGKVRLLCPLAAAPTIFEFCGQLFISYLSLWMVIF